MEQMQKIKYFFRNINLINTLLLVLITFFVIYSILPSFYTDIKYFLPAIEKRHEVAEKTESVFSPHSPAEYLIIGDDNIFHPERIIPREKLVEKEVPKPDFVLYGTMVSDELGIAYLEDIKAPRTTTGRGKRQIPVREGDVLSGFTVKDIEANRVIMVRGEERMVVNIFDKRKTRTSEPTESVAKPSPGQPAQAVQPAIQQAPAQAIQPIRRPVPDRQRAVAAPQPPARGDSAERPPPRSAFESTVRDFFDRPKQ